MNKICYETILLKYSRKLGSVWAFEFSLLLRRFIDFISSLKQNMELLGCNDTFSNVPENINRSKWIKYESRSLYFLSLLRRLEKTI